MQHYLNQNLRIEGNLSIILSDPPCKDGKSLITHRYPLKLCLIKYELDINVYNLENCSFTSCFFCREKKVIIRIKTIINLETWNMFSLLLISLSIKGTVVNRGIVIFAWRVITSNYPVNPPFVSIPAELASFAQPFSLQILSPDDVSSKHFKYLFIDDIFLIYDYSSCFDEAWNLKFSAQNYSFSLLWEPENSGIGRGILDF